MDQYETLPVVPLRDVVVFPHMMMPFVIGRPSSTRALEHALATDKKIFLAAQHDAATDDPQPADIYTMGCVANIVQSLKLPDGNIKVLVEGVERARAVEWKEDKGFYRVTVKMIPKKAEAAADAEAVMSRVVTLFEQYIKLSNNLQYDAMVAAVRVDDPSRLADTIAAHLQVGVEEKQNLLEIVAPVERLSRIIAVLEAEVDKLQVDRRIQSRVKKQMEKAQKEYYLNEKMKAIQRELGRKDEKGNEVDDLKKKIEQARMPKEVEKKAHRRAEAARSDAADVGRSHRLAQLPRLADRGALAQEDQGEPRPQARRARSSTRTTSGSRRSRSASSSSSPSARWSRSRRRRSSRSPALRASARRRSPSRSRAR